LHWLALWLQDIGSDLVDFDCCYSFPCVVADVFQTLKKVDFNLFKQRERFILVCQSSDHTSNLLGMVRRLMSVVSSMEGCTVHHGGEGRDELPRWLGLNRMCYYFFSLELKCRLFCERREEVYICECKLHWKPSPGGRSPKLIGSWGRRSMAVAGEVTRHG
jgi:hypothetical protein